MQEISYKVDTEKHTQWMSSNWPPPLSTKVAIILTIGLGILPFFFNHWIVWTIVILGIALLWAIRGFTQLPPPQDLAQVLDRGSEPLRFDGDGLHWRHLKGPSKWSWSEVSRFEIEQDRKTGQASIRFDVPDDARLDRMSRWIFKRPSKRIHGQITDVYEASLEEIADSLNKYRDRAVAN